MKAPINPAEAFINFMTHHTDLYIRGSLKADAAKANALYKKLFDDLQPFFVGLRERTVSEAHEQACAVLCERCAAVQHEEFKHLHRNTEGVWVHYLKQEQWPCAASDLRNALVVKDTP